MVYSIQEHVTIIENDYENNRSIIRTIRKLRNIFGVNNRPTKATICRIVNNFKKYGSVAGKPWRCATCNVRTTENIGMVHRSVDKNPNTSIRRRAQ